MGLGGVKFSGKKHYECVRFNVINVMRGWVGVQFPGKKHYVTLEWPLKEFVCTSSFVLVETFNYLIVSHLCQYQDGQHAYNERSITRNGVCYPRHSSR